MPNAIVEIVTALRASSTFFCDAATIGLGHALTSPPQIFFASLKLPFALTPNTAPTPMPTTPTPPSTAAYSLRDDFDVAGSAGGTTVVTPAASTGMSIVVVL